MIKPLEQMVNLYQDRILVFQEEKSSHLVYMTKIAQMAILEPKLYCGISLQPRAQEYCDGCDGCDSCDCDGCDDGSDGCDGCDTE